MISRTIMSVAVTLIAAAAVCFLIAGCADVGAPPGGPEDKQGPVLLESIPQNGSINQSDIRFIEINLSEAVNVGKDPRLSISPRPASAPKVHWSGHSIKVEFSQTLSANRTYIVSLPSDLTDLRGNRADSAITVAFSTGPTLDSCRISGSIFDGDKAAPGITVGLYSTSTLQEGRPYDSTFPDYVAVTGKNGEFSLRNLPAAPFRLIAFKKSARDDRFQPMRDRFGVPDRPIDLTSTSGLAEVNIPLTAQDTMPIKIISAEVNNDRMVQFRLSRALSIRQVAAGGAIILNPGQSQISSLPLVRSDSAMVSQIWAYFGELPPGVAQLVWNIEPEKPAAVFDSLKIPASRDTTPPYIVSVNPDDRPVLYPDTNISLRFSEPIRFASLADTSLSIWSIGDSTPFLYDKMIGGQLELIVKPRGLVAGGGYRLRILQSDIIDFAGNAMGDSVSQFSISVLKPDSLGWIEGKVAVPPADSATRVDLVFRRLKDSRNFVFSDIARSFKVALPAGKYLVTGHVDRNANGQFDKGTIFPYTPSEPFLPFRDTVSVRARFETAGVELNFR